MMNNNCFNLGFLVAVILLLPSCSYFTQVSFEEKRVDDLYAIKIPQYLLPAQNLNLDASFQYQNKNRDLCVVIRYDDRQNLLRRQPGFELEDFFDVTIERIQAGLENPQVPAYDSLKLHAYPCFIATIIGDFRGDRLIYRLAVVQGEEHIFQILTWTISEKYSKYEGDMNKIIQSFHIIKKKELEIYGVK